MQPMVPARPWELEGSAVVEALASDADAGLRGSTAEERWRHDASGPGARPRAPARPRDLLAPASVALLGMLGIALAAVLLLGDVAALVALSIAVGLTAAMVPDRAGTRGRRLDATLRRLAARDARVVRDHRPTTIAAPTLVPGDIVVLGAGEVVPADLRLLATTWLCIDERALTGRREASVKDPRPLPAIDGDEPAELRNTAFAGTTVTFGQGRGVVIATGGDTAIARAARLWGEREPPMSRFDRGTLWVAVATGAAALVAGAAAFALGVARDAPVGRAFDDGLTVVVAAIPESLPLVVLVAILLVARRVTRSGVRIQSRSAVTTLGAVDVLVVGPERHPDGHPVADRVRTPWSEYRITGERGTLMGVRDPAGDPYLERLARVVGLGDGASLAVGARGGPSWSTARDPLDAALLRVVAASGVPVGPLPGPPVARLMTHPSGHRLTAVRPHGDGWWLTAMGSVDALLPLADRAEAAAWADAHQAARRWSTRGCLAIAFAERLLDHRPATLEDAQVGVSLLGLVGLSPTTDLGDAPGANALRDLGVALVPAGRPRPDGTTVAALWRGEQRIDPLCTDLTVMDCARCASLDRGAADVVLGDGGLGSLADGILGGRRLLHGLRSFLAYALAGGLAASVALVVAPLLGHPAPLSTMQLVWAGLVVQGIVGLALVLAWASARPIAAAPVGRSVVLTPGAVPWVAWTGLLAAAVTLAMQALALGHGWPWQTVTFGAFALLQVTIALALGPPRQPAGSPMVRLRPGPLPAAAMVVSTMLVAAVWGPLAQVLDTRAIGPIEVAAVMLAAATGPLIARGCPWCAPPGRPGARTSGPTG